MATVSKIAKRPVSAPVKVPWWKTGVIYQIYIRSFFDTNGNGIGDLKGVTAKLDYLDSLGIDGIWLSPVTVSANADWGYDVVDYYNIDPALGTMADYEELIAKAKAKGIRIIFDFVPNHTSDQHPWFQNALSGRDAKYRDYYIWADPKPDGTPPSNWKSYASGSAWEFHKPTGQYYLHNFFKGQPDLNWRNQAVVKEFDEIIKFWLGKGVAGFRIDVFNMLIKDSQFRDNPAPTPASGLEIKMIGQEPKYNVSQPEVHEILKHWRKLADQYTKGESGVLIGESTLVYNVKELAAFYGEHDELELAFNLAFIQAPFEVQRLRKVVEQTYSAISAPDWPVWTGSNHDQPRFPTRWAKGDERKTRCAILMILALAGTPVLYYGDELGMQDTFVAPWRLQDPKGKILWPVDAGRDRSRTPMPWKVAKGAGFTEEGVRPWLPYGKLEGRNVEEQQVDPNSTWRFTHDLIRLRHKLKDLREGDYETVPGVPNVWMWQRGGGTLVVINFSNSRQKISGIFGEVLISTDRSRDGLMIRDSLVLESWEGLVIARGNRPPADRNVARRTLRKRSTI